MLHRNNLMQHFFYLITKKVNHRISKAPIRIGISRHTYIIDHCFIALANFRIKEFNLIS